MIGSVLVILGSIVVFVGWIMFLVAAFRESILWFLGCLFFPFPVILIFLIMHWNVAAKPFLIEVLGIVITTIGLAMGGGGTYVTNIYQVPSQAP